MVPARCMIVIALAWLVGAPTASRAQDINSLPKVSFEVFRAPQDTCIAKAPVDVAVTFPGVTTSLKYAYAGSMPAGPAREACMMRGQVTLDPTYEKESQGLLQVLNVAGACRGRNPPFSALQLAVKLVGSGDLGLISCSGSEVCHLYYATPASSGAANSTDGSRTKQNCLHENYVCRRVIKKGIFLVTVSDISYGTCCEGLSCKFSYFVQTGILINRVRVYYYTCQPDAGCFPADAKVDIAGQGLLPISAVRLGDAVLTVNQQSGQLQYSEVYAIPHRELETNTSYIKITDAHNRTLLLSPGHLMYTASHPATRLPDFTARPASKLRVGEYVWSRMPDSSGSFGPSRIEAVASVIAPGRVAPFTMDGTIVVEGVLTSTYATNGIVSAETAHAVLAPLRWMWRVAPGALQKLHSRVDGTGGSPALLTAGLSVLDAAESVQQCLVGAD